MRTFSLGKMVGTAAIVGGLLVSCSVDSEPEVLVSAGQTGITVQIEVYHETTCLVVRRETASGSFARSWCPESDPDLLITADSLGGSTFVAGRFNPAVEIVAIANDKGDRVDFVSESTEAAGVVIALTDELGPAEVVLHIEGRTETIRLSPGEPFVRP